jgi:hypothetical protein
MSDGIVGLAMETVIILAFFLAGLLVGWLAGRANRPEQEIRLTMQIQLDATQPVAIKAVGKDSEGNVIDLSGTDLTITAEAITGNFGEINDEQDTFNPGEAGATGTIKGSVTVNDVVYEAKVEVELVAGGLTEIGLDFVPVP